MTKQDYIRIARAISETRIGVQVKHSTTTAGRRAQGATLDLLVEHLVIELRADNAKFDSARFVSACNVGRA